MEEYIKNFHGEEILKILKSICDSKNARKAIEINLTNLSKQNTLLFKNFCKKYDTENVKWVAALENFVDQLLASENLPLTKEEAKISVEYFEHPEKTWPKLDDLWKVIELRGYVFRSSAPSKIEYLRVVKCLACKKETTVEADRIYNYKFTLPQRCICTMNCYGAMTFKDENKYSTEPNLAHVVKFQDFKLQEVDKFTPKNRITIVEAESNLVKSCSIGDTVRILGILEARVNEEEINIKKFVVRALNIRKENLEMKLILEASEVKNLINAWNEDRQKNDNCELAARDEMLKAVAPELTGCYGLKLAVMIILSSGGKQEKKSTTSLTQMKATPKERELCHLLIAGVPSVGKSQIMKAASKIASRSVLTCGNSSTKAGLTASYYKEDGEYHVEAGALVLANNGVCCIDEFNLLPNSNKQSMHEAMEHQKFTLVRTAMKMEIQTKCSIIAAMNHKLSVPKDSRSNYEDDELKILNIEASLCSRFDLVFLLEKPGIEFDHQILEHILSSFDIEKPDNVENADSTWNLERLKLHVLCARGLEVETTNEVNDILENYFTFCQHCVSIHHSRRTMRLLLSVKRLAVAHAKLMLRKKTKIIDAMTAIWLMENSWTFGDLIQPKNLVETYLPIGPSMENITYVLNMLGCDHLIEVFELEENVSLNESLRPLKSSDLTQNEFKEKVNDMNVFPKKNATEIPEHIQRSLAISSIDDLFDDDDMIAPTKSSDTVKLTKSDHDDFLISTLPSYNNFKIPTNQTSTQGPSKRSIPPVKEKIVEVKKPKLTTVDTESALKLINASVAESSTKISSTSNFKNRLKAFEYKSQEVVTKENETPKLSEGYFTEETFSESLKELGNKLSAKPSSRKPSKMTEEELIAAMDAEMDPWN